MKKTRFGFFKSKWLIIPLIVIAIGGIIYWATTREKVVVFESAVATIGDVAENVSVTGTISPLDKADLSFRKGGVISAINVKVGDRVKKGDVLATLSSGSDAASLAAAEATLADLSRSLRPEELAVAKAALDGAEDDAYNAVHDSLVKTQSAVFNYADIFYTNPQSPNPSINLRADTVQKQILLNNQRIAVTGALSDWSIAAVSPQSETNPLVLLNKVRKYADTIKEFMTSLSVVVNSLTPGNSGLTQTAIASYVSSINTGLSTINNATDAIATAQSALSTAQSNFNLKVAGNSSESISAQRAKVAQARAELRDASIVSPISGIVTRVEPNVGEYIAPGQSGFAVQNTEFKIEANVPEADIAKVAVGNIASSTLDAYGSGVDFPARVSMIDPAETVLEGVPTYKVTLLFMNSDPRVRSGMTANLEIHTNQRNGVLNIPYRAIVVENNTKVVRVVNADGKTWTSVPVKVGLKGSSGSIEILSGINVGDVIVTYVK